MIATRNDCRFWLVFFTTAAVLGLGVGLTTRADENKQYLEVDEAELAEIQKRYRHLHPLYIRAEKKVKTPRKETYTQSPNQIKERPDRDHARMEIEELMRKAHKLNADGRHEESREVARMAEKLKAGIGHGERKHRNGRGDPNRDERRRDLEHMKAEVGERVAQLKREIEELKHNRRFDEAERRQEEMRQLINEFERMHRDRDEGAHPGHGEHERAENHDHGELEEMHQRLEHMHQAIEHLHAAGMHEQAEHLSREAEQWEHEIRAHQEQREHEAHADEFRHELENRLRKLEGGLRELGVGYQQLRKKIEELTREHN